MGPLEADMLAHCPSFVTQFQLKASVIGTFKEESYCWQSLTCYFCLVENTEFCDVDLSLFGVGAKGVSAGYVWVYAFC